MYDRTSDQRSVTRGLVLGAMTAGIALTGRWKAAEAVPVTGSLPAAPDHVADRPGDELTQSQPEQAGTQRRPDERRRGRQVTLDGWRTGQVHIDRQAPNQGQSPQDQDEQRPLTPASRERGSLTTSAVSSRVDGPSGVGLTLATGNVHENR